MNDRLVTNVQLVNTKNDIQSELKKMASKEDLENMVSKDDIENMKGVVLNEMRHIFPHISSP